MIEDEVEVAAEVVIEEGEIEIGIEAGTEIGAMTEVDVMTEVGVMTAETGIEIAIEMVIGIDVEEMEKEMDAMVVGSWQFLIPHQNPSCTAFMMAKLPI
jgi:hypothetical protein